MIIEVAGSRDARLRDYAFLNDPEARREREGDDYFIAEGYLAIDRVIDSGHRLRSVLVTPSRLDRFRTAHPSIADGEVPVYVVERDVLAATVGFDLHRGVVASADRRPAPSIGEVATSARCVAVLVGLNDAENVGAIARTARALRIDALVLDPTCTDAYSRRSVRVSLGEILHLPVARSTDLPSDLDVLHHAGFESWAMTPAPDATSLWSVAPHDVPHRVAVVLGPEGPGLDDSTMTSATHRIRIPLDPAVDSLNVGHAAAITFAALRRNIGP